MASKIKIEHNSQGWIDAFTSPGMQSAVDAAGERIASEAGDNFGYMAGSNSRFTAGGFVSAHGIVGSLEEATDKVLTKAVHR